MKGIALKTRFKSDRCYAARCRQAPVEQHLLPGEPLRFCAKHAEEAKAEYGDDPPEIQVLTPEPAAPTDPTALVAQSDKDQLAAEHAELSKALELVREFEIGTDEDVSFAEESRALTKGQWKDYEEKRTAATKPINAALREINSWFKPVQTVLKAIENEWSRKLKEAHLRAQEERERLLEVADAAVEAEAPAGEIRETLVAASESSLATSEVKFRDRWVFEITNPDLVPREYCCPDDRKIGQVVAAMKDQTKIPGVRAYNDPIVSGPTKKS